MHLQNNLIKCVLQIVEHIAMHMAVHIGVPAHIRFSYYAPYIIMVHGFDQSTMQIELKFGQYIGSGVMRVCKKFGFQI